MGTRSEEKNHQAGKRGAKLGGRMIGKFIRYIGISSFLLFFLLFIIVIAAATEFEQSISALKGKDNYQEEEEASSSPRGKATYVGVDDTDTEFSLAILKETRKYDFIGNPYFNGYMNLCEAWCHDIYTAAGLPYDGACCAYQHGRKTAITMGKIPKGALVFSGQKPDGTFYENGHAAGCFCTVCGNWAGHVGIYVGDGLIAGSQIPYLMPVDTWIEICGYGGFSTH